MSNALPLGLTAVAFVPLALRFVAPTLSNLLDSVALAEEILLDLLIIAAAARLARPEPRGGAASDVERRALYVVSLSFAATLLSTFDFQIMSRYFGITLAAAMGTWIELVVNIPYIAFYVLGATALAIFAAALPNRRSRLIGAALSVAVLAAILALYLQGLNKTGNPFQNRVIHIFCFAASASVYGFGFVCLFSRGAGVAHRLLGFGYMSLALSGLLFQATEIFHGIAISERWLDATWTAGQVSAACGLLRLRVARL